MGPEGHVPNSAHNQHPRAKLTTGPVPVIGATYRAISSFNLIARTLWLNVPVWPLVMGSQVAAVHQLVPPKDELAIDSNSVLVCHLTLP